MMCQTRHPNPQTGLSRRSFVHLATVGVGAAIVTGIGPAQANGSARALMLSCMDYRLVDDLITFMSDHEYHDNYDHVVLAGASLGVVHEAFADWHATFWQHLDVAIELHGITEVIVIDHRDCGAYRLALGAEAVDTAEKETAAHREHMQMFARQVSEKHPDLRVFGVLMGLDGVGENIMAGATEATSQAAMPASDTHDAMADGHDQAAAMDHAGEADPTGH